MKTVGTYFNNRYENTFYTNRSAEEVWGSMQRINTSSGEPMWLSAWPSVGDKIGTVLDAKPEKLIRVQKEYEPCAGSEIQVMISREGTETWITVYQSNLPEWVRRATDLFVYGGDLITADFAMYIESGVLAHRHQLPWPKSGFMAAELGSGLSVTMVMPDTYATRIGLQSGDLIVSVQGAPVLTQQSLQTAFRVLAQNQEVETCWLRGKEFFRQKSIV